jgi:class 3 adenylate cyclase
MFANITGVNALYDELGDARALMNMTRCLALLEDQADEHRGQLVKTIGDQILCLFPDASSAASAAVAMQQRIENFAASAALTLGVKIGLHSGSLIEDRGDVFGIAVNTAARFMQFANPGQIVSDATTVSGMRVALRKRARTIDRRAIKGTSGEIEIIELSWRRRAGAPFTTEQSALLQQRPCARIALFVSGRVIVVDSTSAAFTIGRDASNALRVPSRNASRQHAHIEWRRDKFVLFDHSTNGTYVRLEGEPEMLVKHESFLLRGRGVFCLGEPVKTKSKGVIAFECR